MAVPTVVGSTTNDALPTVSGGILANDLLIQGIYLEPNNEGSSSATYGTVTPPSGWTAASFSPVASNDANILTNNTNRNYLAYKWAVGGETGNIDWTFGSGDYLENANGTIVVRGAKDSSGSYTGSPFLMYNTNYFAGSSDGGSGPATNVMPAVSVDTTSLAVPCLLMFYGTCWDDGGNGSLSGWTDVVNQGGTGTTLSYAQSAAGPSGSIAPTTSSNHDFFTSILFALGAPSSSSGGSVWLIGT